MSEPGLFEEGQVVDPADIQQMALIEVGAAASEARIVGVNERCVIAIGRVVDRVAIGVGRAQVQGADAATSCDLQSIVVGVRLIFQTRNGVESKERAEEVGVSATRNAQIDRGLTGDGDSAGGCHGSAVVMERIAGRIKSTADRFSWLVRVRAGGHRIELIEVALQSRDAFPCCPRRTSSRQYGSVVHAECRGAIAACTARSPWWESNRS